ncbi:MAG: cbb3-type cytochrome c oxidase subunit I [Verrucomicrobia bacterium]|nr:cbb3-type cytochrome c oxidase subunit I [Verrucomicrobiota bacterium]
MSVIVTEEEPVSSASGVTPAAVGEAATLIQSNAAEVAAIDRSVRLPVLLFFGAGLIWLLGGSLLHLLAAIKMHEPRLLSSVAFLTYGRLWPAANDALLYGWLSTAGLGLALWLAARLCRARLRHEGLLTVAWAVWNAGVLLGVLGVLGGNSTSFEWLEFPWYAAVVLLGAYAFISVWMLLMFRARREGNTYASLWYLLAALLCFPWLYATANFFLLFLPVQASAQAPVNWWFVHGFYGLWLTPLALAAAYYLVPKVLGRTIHNYPLAVLGFWSWLLFSGWRGGQSLVDGPVPVWMSSVGIGAAIFTIIPLVAITNNLFGTFRGRGDAWGWSPSLRFTHVGLLCFVAATISGILLAIRSINRVLHFTQMEVAWNYLALYGFVSMILFGAMYYTVPRLAGWDWPSQNFIRYHFWLCLAGLGTIIFALAMAGIVQGYGLRDPGVPVISTVQMINPLLVTRTCGVLLLGAGHLVFAASFVLVLIRARGGQPVTASDVVGGRRRAPAVATEEIQPTSATVEHAVG